jgi:hypothetical protein
MLNDLQSKTSLGNITMNHFNIDERDRITWWRACSGGVTDAMCNQWNLVAQVVKAQVFGKYIIMELLAMINNSKKFGNSRLHDIGLKAKARDLQLKGEVVPAHIELPKLEDILEMRPSPTANGGGEEVENINKGFVFVAEYLVGAVLGKKEWDNNKFHHGVTKHFMDSDEAFLYVLLANSYDLWKNAEGSKVGTGNLTRDGSSKKFCGWTKQGIKFYNDILEKVKTNRNASWAKNVEDKVMETLKERYNFVRRRNTQLI